MNCLKILILCLSMPCLLGCDSETKSMDLVRSDQSSTPGSSLKSSAQNKHTLEVTATAYTSIKGETDSTPNLTAWGDRLKPGMKAIAVSRDLIKMGLTHRTKVKIEGLSGEYVVLDKMNRRWTKKIDIYMGLDQKKAIKWGKRKVVIHWRKK